MTGLDAPSNYDPFQALLPAILRTPAGDDGLRPLLPWFWASLDVPGDIVMITRADDARPLQIACVARALAVPKVVFHLDMFGENEGAQSDREAFANLATWSRIVPVQPLRGNPGETCKLLHAPVSLLWCHLEGGPPIAGIVATLRSLLSPGAVVSLVSSAPALGPLREDAAAALTLMGMERVEQGDGHDLRFPQPLLRADDSTVVPRPERLEAMIFRRRSPDGDAFDT